MHLMPDPDDETVALPISPPLVAHAIISSCASPSLHADSDDAILLLANELSRALIEIGALRKRVEILERTQTPA